MQIVRLAILACTLAGLLLAQPGLRITSPADGATVHPGELLPVTVEVSPLEGAFSFVFVAGGDPIGFNKQMLDKPPYRFSVQIPLGIRPGKYPNTAAGVTSSTGQQVNSNSISIFIDRADSPISITVYPVTAEFTMGQKRYLQVTGLYADQTTADLTQASRVKYASGAPGIATVSPQGIVTPVTPGSGKITVIYGDLKLEVPVRVREIRLDYVDDGV